MSKAAVDLDVVAVEVQSQDSECSEKIAYRTTLLEPPAGGAKKSCDEARAWSILVGSFGSSKGIVLL